MDSKYNVTLSLIRIFLEYSSIKLLIELLVFFKEYYRNCFLISNLFSGNRMFFQEQ